MQSSTTKALHRSTRGACYSAHTIPPASKNGRKAEFLSSILGRKRPCPLFRYRTITLRVGYIVSRYYSINCSGSIIRTECHQSLINSHPVDIEKRHSAFPCHAHLIRGTVRHILRNFQFMLNQEMTVQNTQWAPSTLSTAKASIVFHSPSCSYDPPPAIPDSRTKSSNLVHRSMSQTRSTTSR